MTLLLNLGVVEIAYGEANGGATTTGEVAQILENNYEVMGHFFANNVAPIGDWLAKSISGEITNIALGKSPARNPFAGGEQNIEERFRDFITTGEAEQFTGQTQAAADRKSKRFKKGKSNKPRVSFVDSGLYVDSFRAWVQDNG